MGNRSLRSFSLIALFAGLASLHGTARASTDDDIRALTKLNEDFQKAVLKSDVATMDAIVALDFVFYSSSGTEITKKELLADARRKELIFTRNESSNVRVRIWGDTGTVTASLWEMGTDKNKQFNNHVEFFDVYVRTPAGWRYVAGRAWVKPQRTK